MPKYNVHIYREMRLMFTDIEASTPEEAAKIASGKSTDHAEYMEDCEGKDFAALVDLVGDEEYLHTKLIDFTKEAAPCR